MSNSKINFETFKKELTSLFMFLPEPRPDWEEWMHEWYVDYKKMSSHYFMPVKEWAEQWFEDVTLKTHTYMLKSKAVKQRNELMLEGYRFSGETYITKKL